jgi:branched-chain amino acid transport system ATP-binding protein
MAAIDAGTGAVLQTRGLVKRFGGYLATDNVDFDLRRGEMHALIGPNGAGKTTFIKQITGEILPDEGLIVLENIDITGLPTWRRILAGIGRSFQVTSVFREFTAIENVILAIRSHTDHGFHFWRPVSVDTALRARARDALARVGLVADGDRRVRDLAYGQLRQLELAMAIAGQPKVLLLDEPMAGMGAGESELVIELIRSFRSQFAVLLVEHDMNAVFALADRITVLVYGRVLASGTPDEIRTNADVRKSYLGQLS